MNLFMEVIDYEYDHNGEKRRIDECISEVIGWEPKHDPNQLFCGDGFYFFKNNKFQGPYNTLKKAFEAQDTCTAKI